MFTIALLAGEAHQNWRFPVGTKSILAVIAHLYTNVHTVISRVNYFCFRFPGKTGCLRGRFMLLDILLRRDYLFIDYAEK